MCVAARISDTHVEVTGKATEVSFLFPSCGAPRTNAGHQAWWQMPLPTEAPCWPDFVCETGFLHIPQG